MKWLAAKVDSLIGTVFAAVMGLLASQFLAFIHQYRQSLGGHLAKAQLAERQTREARGGQPTPELLQTMSDRVTDQSLRLCWLTCCLTPPSYQWLPPKR